MTLTDITNTTHRESKFIVIRTLAVPVTEISIGITGEASSK